MHAPELLSPAGTLKSMRYAFAYGADAVYAGQPRYSLRVRNNEFDLPHLATGIQEAHQMGKKFLLVSNIAPHNSKIKTYIKDLEPVIALQPDALIMSDPGLIMMVKEKWPDAEIHLSVQSNVVNYAAVQFWQKMGIRRIILSRELGLNEIQEIRDECPDIELEVFVHGALCMAYSGRCLLSGYINHRDPNQGTCTNACRWSYNATPATTDAFGNVEKQTHVLEQTYVIEQAGREDRGITMTEDEHGTYMLNSKDLRAIHHVEKFVKMGIHCLKIEGRTKSHFYVARTAQLYRQAIDDALAGKPFDIKLMDALEGLSNRGYTEGLLRRHVHDAYQNYEQGTSVSRKQQFVGEVIDYDPASALATIDVKNKFSINDQIELMLPSGNQIFTLNHIENQEGTAMTVAKGSGHIVKIPVESSDDLQYGLMMRFLDDQ